jgi:hypothetical protein
MARVSEGGREREIDAMFWYRHDSMQVICIYPPPHMTCMCPLPRHASIAHDMHIAYGDAESVSRRRPGPDPGSHVMEFIVP